jgi:Tfp pilus assembly protein PilZ
MARQRLDVRYSIRFPVQLVYAKRARSLVTEDISGGGVFLCTEAPPPLLQLVHVKLVLPIGGRALTAHGMTVHVVEPENPAGRTPGIGIQFYGLDQATRDAWLAFTQHVEAHYPQSPDQTPLRLGRGETPEPLKRRFGRHTAVLELKPRTVASLERLYMRDVPTGAMFIPTPLDLAVGADVVINITHPETRAPFLFEAKVLLVNPDPPGVGVELRGIDERFKQDFLEFIRGPIVYDSQVMMEDPPDGDPDAGSGNEP